MNIIQRTFEIRNYDGGNPLPIQISEPVNAERVIRFIASDDTVDRYNEVILPTAWDLGNYVKNPVVMQFHDYGVWPIGKAVAVGVVDGKLMIDTEFDPADIDADADKVYKKIKHGSVRTGSVGFLPIEWEQPSKENRSLFENYKGATRIFTRAELIEWTICPIPANPSALAAAMSEDAQRRFGNQSTKATKPDYLEVAKKLDDIINLMEK